MFTGVNEGWGITRHNNILYVTDGTHSITKIDAISFESIGSFKVTFEDGTHVRNLNELEYVDGYLWVNVFTTNFIAKVDPVTGLVA